MAELDRCWYSLLHWQRILRRGQFARGVATAGVCHLVRADTPIVNVHEIFSNCSVKRASIYLAGRFLASVVVNALLCASVNSPAPTN